MENLLISASQETPKIEFSFSEGFLSIIGKSIPEDSITFYEPLMAALNEYITKPNPLTKVDFKYEYFNTSSSKCILQVLQILQKVKDKNCDVIINWFYDEDDEEILESGQDYSKFINIPFNLKMIPNN
jgi:hypothetical protein